MVTFKQIDRSRKILGLAETATLEEIKNSYKQLALKFHPDRCQDEKKKECEAMFKEISHAYDILQHYCNCYRYSFKEKDVAKNTIDTELYEHLKKFYDGWLGDLDL